VSNDHLPAGFTIMSIGALRVRTWYGPFTSGAGLQR
jgi:hypothetical protein